jgi:hypothetical protein
MPNKRKPSSPPLNRAVDDEDPDYSPMDEVAAKKNKDATKPKARPEDMPGAEGLTSARADEDTYD